MKNIKIAFLLISVLFLNSCKKCIVCSNRCYYCQNFTDILCSNTSISPAVMDTIIALQIRSGNDCHQVAPTSSTQYCGSYQDRHSIEDLLTIEGYDCKTK